MKKILAITIIAAMALSVTACGSSSDSSTTASAESQETSAEASSAFTPALDTDISATINVLGSWGNFEALVQVAIDFQEYYPNVEVVYSQMSDPHNDLANRCATGEDIDLFCIDWWNPEYAESEGLMMDVSSVTNYAEDYDEAGIDLSNLDKELLKSGQLDDKQLLIPLYTTGYGYIVNLDIFEENNIEVPTNYEELKSCLAKLVEAGYETPLYVNSGHLGKSYTPLYIDKILAGTDYETAFKECLAEEEALLEAGYLNMEGDTLDDNYEALLLRFFEGDIPIVTASASTFSGAAKREAKSETFQKSPFSYAYVPAVYDDSKAPYTMQLSDVYLGIYKDSKQLDLVNEFVRFMLQDDEMLTLQSIKHLPTANINNGKDTFPYLQTDKATYCAATEGISVMDEQIFTDSVSAYVPGESTDAAMEIFTNFMEEN